MQPEPNLRFCEFLGVPTMCPEASLFKISLLVIKFLVHETAYIVKYICIL